MTAALWLHVLFLAPRVLLQSPPGLEQYVPLPGFNLCASHGIPVEAAPAVFSCLKHANHSFLFVPCSWEHILCALPLSEREMLVLPWLETHSTVGTDLRAGSGPFPEPRALVLPSVDFGPSKPDGHSYMNAIDRDLMHHHFRPSLLPCAKILPLLRGVLQKASVHIPHISEQFLVCTSNTDLTNLIIKTPLSLTL